MKLQPNYLLNLVQRTYIDKDSNLYLNEYEEFPPHYFDEIPIRRVLQKLYGRKAILISNDENKILKKLQSNVKRIKKLELDREANDFQIRKLILRPGKVDYLVTLYNRTINKKVKDGLLMSPLRDCHITITDKESDPYDECIILQAPIDTYDYGLLRTMHNSLQTVRFQKIKQRSNYLVLRAIPATAALDFIALQVNQAVGFDALYFLSHGILREEQQTLRLLPALIRNIKFWKLEFVMDVLDEDLLIPLVQMADCLLLSAESSIGSLSCETDQLKIDRTLSLSFRAPCKASSLLKLCFSKHLKSLGVDLKCIDIVDDIGGNLLNQLKPRSSHCLQTLCLRMHNSYLNQPSAIHSYIKEIALNIQSLLLRLYVDDTERPPSALFEQAISFPDLLNLYLTCRIKLPCLPLGQLASYTNLQSLIMDLTFSTYNPMSWDSDFPLESLSQLRSLQIRIYAIHKWPFSDNMLWSSNFFRKLRCCPLLQSISLFDYTSCRMELGALQIILKGLGKPRCRSVICLGFRDYKREQHTQILMCVRKYIKKNAALLESFALEHYHPGQSIRYQKRCREEVLKRKEKVAL